MQSNTQTTPRPGQVRKGVDAGGQHQLSKANLIIHNAEKHSHDCTKYAERLIRQEATRAFETALYYWQSKGVGPEDQGSGGRAVLPDDGDLLGAVSRQYGFDSVVVANATPIQRFILPSEVDDPHPWLARNTMASNGIDVGSLEASSVRAAAGKMLADDLTARRQYAASTLLATE